MLQPRYICSVVSGNEQSPTKKYLHQANWHGDCSEWAMGMVAIAHITEGAPEPGAHLLSGSGQLLPKGGQ